MKVNSRQTLFLVLTRNVSSFVNINQSVWLLKTQLLVQIVACSSFPEIKLNQNLRKAAVTVS